MSNLIEFLQSIAWGVVRLAGGCVHVVAAIAGLAIGFVVFLVLATLKALLQGEDRGC